MTAHPFSYIFIMKHSEQLYHKDTPNITWFREKGIRNGTIDDFDSYTWYRTMFHMDPSFNERKINCNNVFPFKYGGNAFYKEWAYHITQS